MITYYLDTSVDADASAAHAPHQQRRPVDLRQHAWARRSRLDVINMQVTYDISNGAGNPGNVR